MYTTNMTANDWTLVNKTILMKALQKTSLLNLSSLAS